MTATDYRGTIEALKFKKAELGHLGPKSYVEASTNNYANVEPDRPGPARRTARSAIARA